MTDISKDEQDIFYSIGFLQEWVKKEHETVKDSVDIVIGGIDYYRNKLEAMTEDYNKLNEHYTRLTGLSAGYLQLIQELRGQNEQLLIDGQRDLHHGEE